MSEALLNDPVLALITEHERLWALETEESDEEANVIHDELSHTKPTTIVGAIAQLKFAVKYDDVDMADIVADGMREMDPVELPSGVQSGWAPEQQNVALDAINVLLQARPRSR